MRKPLIWAHRGASGWDKKYYAENTMQAFDCAMTMGADGIELDVQLTKDGELVVCHDETIDRTSDGHGNIRDYTLSELRQFDFSRPHPEQGRTRIPLLKDVLDLIKNEKVTLNIELKTGVVRYPGIEQKTVEMVHEFGLEDRIWYSSFNHESVLLAHELAPASHCGYLLGQPILSMPEYAVRYGAEALHPARGILNLCPDLIVKSHAAGVRVHVWVVDNLKDMENVAKMDVDAFFTDCPDNARMIVDNVK